MAAITITTADKELAGGYHREHRSKKETERWLPSSTQQLRGKCGVPATKDIRQKTVHR